QCRRIRGTQGGAPGGTLPGGGPWGSWPGPGGRGWWGAGPGGGGGPRPRRGVGVAAAAGRLLPPAGHPDLVTSPRSCAKPFQALAVRALGVEDELGLGQLALAGACGSHNGEPDHVASVRKVLDAAGLGETALPCPPALPTDRTARQQVDGPAAVYHNCSGKHAY